MSDSDMTGFQTNAFGQDISESNGYWDYAPADNFIGASVEQVYPDSNIPDTSSTSVSYESNSGPSVFQQVQSTAQNFPSNLKTTLDYGLKLADSSLAAYGKLQQLETDRYLKTTQADVFRTNAQTAQEVARLTGQAKVQSAQMLANAARSGAGLASLGQTNSSFMLYLTILGVVFAGIQVMKSAR